MQHGEPTDAGFAFGESFPRRRPLRALYRAARRVSHEPSPFGSTWFPPALMYASSVLGPPSLLPLRARNGHVILDITACRCRHRRAPPPHCCVPMAPFSQRVSRGIAHTHQGGTRTRQSHSESGGPRAGLRMQSRGPAREERGGRRAFTSRRKTWKPAEAAGGSPAEATLGKISRGSKQTADRSDGLPPPPSVIVVVVMMMMMPTTGVRWCPTLSTYLCYLPPFHGAGSPWERLPWSA